MIRLRSRWDRRRLANLVSDLEPWYCEAERRAGRSRRSRRRPIHPEAAVSAAADSHEPIWIGVSAPRSPAPGRKVEPTPQARNSVETTAAAVLRKLQLHSHLPDPGEVRRHGPRRPGRARRRTLVDSAVVRRSRSAQQARRGRPHQASRRQRERAVGQSVRDRGAWNRDTQAPPPVAQESLPAGVANSSDQVGTKPDGSSEPTELGARRRAAVALPGTAVDVGHRIVPTGTGVRTAAFRIR